MGLLGAIVDQVNNGELQCERLEGKRLQEALQLIAERTPGYTPSQVVLVKARTTDRDGPSLGFLWSELEKAAARSLLAPPTETLGYDPLNFAAGDTALLPKGVTKCPSDRFDGLFWRRQ